MKILTERQYAEAIKEAIDRFSERRDTQAYVDARLREVEEQLQDIRGSIGELKSRIRRFEEIYPLKPKKAKSPRTNEAVPMPFISLTGEEEL